MIDHRVNLPFENRFDISENAELLLKIYSVNVFFAVCIYSMFSFNIQRVLEITEILKIQY